MKLSAGAVTHREELRVTEAIDGVWRVTRETLVLGYVLEAGEVYVTLEGSVFNTALEVAQSLDFERAVHALER